MKKLALTLVLTLSMACMGGCTNTTNGMSNAADNQPAAAEQASGANSSVLTEDVAAIVNDQTIAKDDFEDVYAFTSENYINVYGQGDKAILEEEINGRTFADLLKENIINSMIIDVLVEEKMKADKIEISAEEIDEKYDTFKQTQIDKNEDLKKFLEENELDETFIKERIAKQLLVSKFSEKIKQPLINNIDFTSDEYVDKVAKVSARHILVKTEKEAKAVKERLNKGEDFAEIAKELSQDPGSAQNGGDLGYFYRGMMIDNFEEAAFNLGAGQVSEPVQTQFGYHIIKVDDKKTYQNLLDTDEGQLELEQQKPLMIENKFNEAYASEIDKMMTENDITINYEAIGISPVEVPDEIETESTTK